MSGSLNANAGPRYRHTADDSAPYETITVDKLTPIIGAELGGVDLSKDGLAAAKVTEGNGPKSAPVATHPARCRLVPLTRTTRGSTLTAA